MRIKWIDALRGYGAIGVVLVHLIQAMQERELLGSGFVFDYLLNGARAVQLFFMITGLTTFMVLDSKSGGGTLNYYKKRWLAIFPTYILMSIVYLLLGHGYSLIKMGDDKVPFTIGALLLNILGLSGFSPKYINIVPGGWYVGIVVIYYILAPFIRKIVNSTSQAVKFCFVALVVRIGFHTLSSILFDGNEEISAWADMFILNQLVFIAIGQLLYFILIKKDVKITKVDQMFVATAILYVTLQVDSLMLWSLFIVSFIIMAACIENSILINKLSLLFGKYSFEIYLLHNAIIYLFFYFAPRIQVHQYVDLGIAFILILIVTLIASVGLNNGMKFVKKNLSENRKELSHG